MLIGTSWRRRLALLGRLQHAIATKVHVGRTRAGEEVAGTCLAGDIHITQLTKSALENPIAAELSIGRTAAVDAAADASTGAGH